MPSAGACDWKRLLLDPAKHWRRGRSARTLACCWEDANGFPPEISAVLASAPALTGIAPLLIFPEWKVSLPGGSRPSQNDVWVLATCDVGLVSIAVEGKVDESFGNPVVEWRKKASDGKTKRLAYLADMLGLPQPIPDDIYYQLLHRAASALIEAARFRATQSVMLVHSFSDKDAGFDAFHAFVALYNKTAEPEKLCAVTAKDGAPLHLGWARGDRRYLAA